MENFSFKKFIILNIIVFIFVLFFYFSFKFFLENDSSGILAKISAIFVEVYLTLTLLVTLFITISIIIIKFISYICLSRWLNDMERVNFINKIIKYEVIISEINKNKKIDLNTNIDLFIEISASRRKNLKRGFNNKIIINSIKDLNKSLKNGFTISKKHTLKQKLLNVNIELSEHDFKKFVIYFIFFIFFNNIKYIESDYEFDEILKKLKLLKGDN